VATSAHDGQGRHVGRPARGELAAFFRPRNVALVGASDRSAWSQSIFARFGDYGHEGALFAVNRNGAGAHGLPGYQRVADIPAPIDMAYIYVPAAAVPDALRQAAEAGVRNAVILSSGFAEAGEEGAALQRALADVAAEHGMRVLGPNSLGFANFAGKSFCTSIRCRLPVKTGPLAIVSQSGAVANELAKWAHVQGIGLSFLGATGNEAQIGITDVIDYLVDAPETGAIALYVEGINDPARFMAVAQRAKAAAKPIVLLKLGRSEVSRSVAQAHTGSLVGDDGVFDAMCRRYGITRANSIEELIVTADFLGRCGPIDPPRIGMVSVSGGACGMYADLAEIHGVAITPWSAGTQAALRAILPPFAATLNPLDVTGVLVQEQGLWADVIPPVASDPGMGLAVVGYNIPNTPLEAANVGPSFEAIAEGYRRVGKPPVILSFTVQDVTPEQANLRARLGLDMVLPSLDIGVRALGHLQRWSEALAAPSCPAGESPAAPPRPQTEREVLDHLATHGVPVIPAAIGGTADEAVAAAARFGGPVAMKIASPDIAHKTEAGGVRLGVEGAAAVQEAFEGIVASVAAHAPTARIDGVIVSPMRAGGTELIVGVARDADWGPVIVVGLGGIFTEALKDSQVRLLPIGRDDARGMLTGLRGARVLEGFRGGPPVDLDALAVVIAAIGDAALALGPDLAALEVNPLRVHGGEIECLDGLAIYEAGRP
jgi:acetate---CoA ligase (ADP-forming)